jgi:DNA invertase Pin-like site-specific DNA recombinase
VADFLSSGSWRHVAELVEVESGARDARPRLTEALALCRLHNATLVIAKLDRLSRDAAFLLNLQKCQVRFVAADMPEANELVVGIMAVVAQAERKMISTRTKAALAAAKVRGVHLGRPENLRNGDEGRAKGPASQRMRKEARATDLRPIIMKLGAEGPRSLRAIAEELNARGIPAARGGAWSAVQVRRILIQTEGAA